MAGLPRRDARHELKRKYIRIRINVIECPSLPRIILAPNAIGGEVARAKPVTERGRWQETQRPTPPLRLLRRHLSPAIRGGEVGH